MSNKQETEPPVNSEELQTDASPTTKRVQTVYLELSNGKKGVFHGDAILEKMEAEADMPHVTNIQFSEPTDIPTEEDLEELQAMLKDMALTAAEQESTSEVPEVEENSVSSMPFPND
tara:strand:- start:155 stop:505 length:351 start_codon:yes stop_codon:yes gene_type:complete